MIEDKCDILIFYIHSVNPHSTGNPSEALVSYPPGFHKWRGCRLPHYRPLSCAHVELPAVIHQNQLKTISHSAVVREGSRYSPANEGGQSSITVVRGLSGLNRRKSRCICHFPNISPNLISHLRSNPTLTDIHPPHTTSSAIVQFCRTNYVAGFSFTINATPGIFLERVSFIPV